MQLVRLTEMSPEIDKESLLLMGRIWRPHGIKGEVKVIPETDDPERFSDLTAIFAGKTTDTTDRIGVESVRYQSTKKGTLVVLKLTGIDSREDAEQLRKTLVFAHPDELPPLDEDEFFLHDLIGLTVETEDGTMVGIVDDVLELPSQELLVISRRDAASAMIPAVEEFIIDIDLDAERVVVRPIEGLLD